MKFVIVVLLAIAVLSSAFRISNRPLGIRSLNALRMMSDEPSAQTSIVPVDKENIENAAAFTGGILGFVLGGPVVGIVLAAVTNYVSKKDNESGEAIRGLGKTVVESYNFLSKLNDKYKVVDTVTETVSDVVDKNAADIEALGTVKSTISSTTTKVAEITKEYDLLTKGKDALIAARNLSDAALEKVEELNAKVRNLSSFHRTVLIILISINFDVLPIVRFCRNNQEGRFHCS